MFIRLFMNATVFFYGTNEVKYYGMSIDFINKDFIGRSLLLVTKQLACSLIFITNPRPPPRRV